MTSKNKILFTNQLFNDRERKNLLFLNLIKKHATTSRTEMSKQSDINIVTVSNYVNNYLKKGLVLERGYDISSGGRRPELIELNKEWGCMIGIDVGESLIKGILIDLTVSTLSESSIIYKEKLSEVRTDDLENYITETTKNLINKAKVDSSRVKNIGVGISSTSNNIVEKIINMKDKIESETGLSVLIGSGAVCAAFGEKDLNPEARNVSNLLYIYTDLGEGVIIKDEEFYEANPAKVEYAYLKKWNKNLSMSEEAKKIVEKGIGTRIVDMAKGDINNITTGTVVEAAKEKDEVAMDLVKTAGTNLGVRVTYLINSFRPETVIVGGGIEKAEKLFMDPLTESVKRFVLQDMQGKVKLVPAVLGEEACVKGVALLATREAFIDA